MDERRRRAASVAGLLLLPLALGIALGFWLADLDHRWLSVGLAIAAAIQSDLWAGGGVDAANGLGARRGESIGQQQQPPPAALCFDTCSRRANTARSRADGPAAPARSIASSQSGHTWTAIRSGAGSGQHGPLTPRRQISAGSRHERT